MELFLGFPGGSDGKESPAMQETWVQSLGLEDPLEKGLATHSSILAWRIPMDCSPPGSSVHGILLARILKSVAIFFSGGSSQPRDQTQVSCIAGDSLPSEPSRKPTYK